MKIDSAAAIRNAAPRPGRAAARPGDSGFAARLAVAPAAGRVTGSGPLGALGALLAAQAADEPGERRRRAVQRGRQLLDLLDELRAGLLTGGLSRDVLRGLAELVGQGREQLDDPSLSTVLDELDLRVQVELAKHLRNG